MRHSSGAAQRTQAAAGAGEIDRVERQDKTKAEGKQGEEQAIGRITHKEGRNDPQIDSKSRKFESTMGKKRSCR